MADVEPYVMIDIIMSKTVAIEFVTTVWQIVLIVVAYFGPHICYG